METVFEWEINIDMFDGKEVGDNILSPQFSFNSAFDSGSTYNGHLSLYPKGDEEEESKDSIALYLFAEDINENMDVRFYFLLLNKNNEQVISFYSKYKFEDYTSGWGTSEFTKASFIRDPKNKILKENKFTIICKVTVEKNIVLTAAEEKKKENACRLEEFESFGKLLVTKSFSDITITADEKSFELHKCILSTRSSVFEAMFKSDMKESTQNIVKIEDIKSEVLEELFRYIYTGKVNDVTEIICELLTAAEKYCVDGLKMLCEDKMCDYLELSNAVEYLKFAIINNAEKAKKEIMKCILFSLEILIEREEFNELCKQYPEVIIEFLKGKMLSTRYPPPK